MKLALQDETELNLMEPELAVQMVGYIGHCYAALL